MASNSMQMVLVLVFTTLLPSVLSALPTSTISAAPALLPNHPPLTSPTVSPDISPLFPSPAGDGLSPTESSLPIIPSSPSPPNPDDMVAASGPAMAFPPSESMPASSSLSLNSHFGSLSSIIFLGLLPFFFLQLSCL